MILVNLLPEDLRKKKESHFLFQRRKIAKTGGICFAILTFIFYYQYQFSLKTASVLQIQWSFVEKDVGRVNQLRKSIEDGSKKEREFLERYVVSTFPNTAILSAVSEHLPNSVWLLELKILRQPDENALLLKGLSLPSQSHSTIKDIEKYLRDLKGQFPPQTDVILTTSRQHEKNKELTLFTAVFKWP